MEKFILVTRGRTGSTAVIDELDKCRDLVTTQELFLRINRTGKYYKLLPPFDYWKQQACWWKRIVPNYFRDPRQAKIYLMLAEKLAHNQAAKGFGFKVLSNHFDERPFLGRLLRKRGYRVVYLRRNIVWQVLSGMVANQRGIYNSLEKVVDERRYQISIEKFKGRVQSERDAVKNDCAMLGKMHFDVIEVSYEDFCANREVFYSGIFNFLHLPPEKPPSSDFVKVIEDPRMVIANYDEVADIATSLGEGL